MGLAMEDDNIGIYKVYIKDANSLENLTLPPLFSENNRLPTYTYHSGEVFNCVYIHSSISHACI